MPTLPVSTILKNLPDKIMRMSREKIVTHYRIGAKAFRIFVHASWITSDSAGRSYPAAGVIEAVMREFETHTPALTWPARCLAPFATPTPTSRTNITILRWAISPMVVAQPFSKTANRQRFSFSTSATVFRRSSASSGLFSATSAPNARAVPRN